MCYQRPASAESGNESSTCDVDADIIAYLNLSGGKRKQLKQFHIMQRPAAYTSQSKAESYYLERWALSSLPATDIEDDHTGVDLRSEAYELAQLGGNHRGGNASRALRRRAQKITVPPVDTATVPLPDAKGYPDGGDTVHPEAIINPDDFTHRCSEQHRSAFDEYVPGGRPARHIVAFRKSTHREDCARRN